MRACRSLTRVGGGGCESLGNVPSLSRLLRAFISKASSAILAQNLLVPILGIFQRLVLQRALDHEGFALLAALLQNMPPYAALRLGVGTGRTIGAGPPL